MPELVDENTKEVAKKLREAERANTGFFPVEPLNMEEIVHEGKMEVIGSGSECVVISPKKHGGEKTGEIKQEPELRDDIVIAIDYRKIEVPDEAKRVFYVQRVLSTLFPHNFPRFYTSYGGDKQRSLSGTIRQRIHERKRFWTRVKYPFRYVEDTVKELGLPIDIDRYPENFIIARDGGEYYLDKTRVLPIGEWDSGEISKYMDTNGYTDTQKRVVSKSVDRLRSLSHSDRTKNKPL